MNTVTPAPEFSRLPRLVLACALTLAVASHAAEPAVTLGADVTTLSLEDLMHVQVPTVTTASKFAQKATDAPASVTVITRDDIQRYGYRTLAEILASARGFYTSSDGAYTYAGVRGFSRPGDYGSRLLLLIDGHRTNENIFASALLGTEGILDVDLIDRVEIIRGPASSLYGSSAFFGVINVLTRAPGSFHAGEAAASVGSLETYTGRLTFAHRFTSGLEILLSGSAIESSGHRRLYFPVYDRLGANHGLAENLDFDRPRTAFLKLAYGDLTIEGAYLSREKGLPNGGFGTVFNDPHNRQRDTLGYLDAKYAHDFGGWEVQARASFNEYRYRGFFPNASVQPDGSAGVVLNEDDTLGKWWLAELQVTHKFGDSHRLTLGADVQDNIAQRQRNYDTGPPFTYGDSSRRTLEYGVFAQDEFRLTRYLTLNAGLRYDWYEQFGSTFNPRVGVIFQPAKTTAIKLLYGRAFRAPNQYETDYRGAVSDPNPALGPERIQSYEAILEHELTPHLRLTLSAYVNRISDLISQETLASGHTRYVNANSANAHGAEAELEGQWAHGVRTRASYAWQETRDGMTGGELTNSPRHQAKLNVLVPFFDDKVSLGLELQYISSARCDARDCARGYLLANATLFSRRLAENFEVSLGVYNLFDQRYSYPAGPNFLEETLPAPSRSFRLKATYSF